MVVISTEARSGPFTADGATTRFDFDFNAASAEEIKVTVDGVELSSALYVVTLNGDNTGYIETTSPIASGEIYIESDPDFMQEASFERYAPFFPDQVNTPFDRSAIRDIYLRHVSLQAMAIAEGANTISTATQAALVSAEADRASAEATHAAAHTAILEALTSAPIEAPLPVVVTHRDVLSALASADAAYLTETGREGMFVWGASDLSAEVTADTEQGIYVPPSSDTTGASGAWKRVVHGFLMPEWFGATGDGTTDDTTAWQALAAFYASGDTIHMGKAKTYRVTSTIQFTKNVTLRRNGSNFLVDHAGLGIEFTPTGEAAGFFDGKTEAGLDIEFKLNKGGTYRAAGSKGFRIAACTQSHIRIDGVEGFETGGDCTGQTTNGTSYGFELNHVFLGGFYDCVYGLNLIDLVSPTRWCTANNFYGGSFNGWPGAGSTAVSGSYHVDLLGAANGGGNTNRFIGTYFQGGHDIGVKIGGLGQNFIACAWEMPQATYYWQFKSGSQSNRIDNPLATQDWVEMFTDAGTYNQVNGNEFTYKKVDYVNKVYYPWIEPRSALQNPVAGKTYYPIGGEVRVLKNLVSGAVDFDLAGANGGVLRLVANGDITAITFSNRPSNFTTFKLEFVQSGAAGFTIGGFPANFLFGTRSAAPLKRAFGQDAYIVQFDGTNYNVIAQYTSGTRPAAITDASTAHALNATFSDTEVEAALNALGTKINSIITALETAGVIAS